MKHFTARRVEIASYVVVSLVASLVVVLAVRSDGFTRHDVDLNDGGVWVSSVDDKAFGRVNKPIDELDGLARVPSSGTTPIVDVVQQGGAVVGINSATSELYAIDPTTALIPDGGATAIAAQSDVTIHGGTLGVVDRATGKMWATPADEELGLTSVVEVDGTGKPLATAGPLAGGTVTAGGNVVAASAETDTLMVLPARAEGWGKATTSGLTLSGAPLLTAVGDDVVVLDTGNGQLVLPGGATVNVPPESALQQAGPAAADVLVTTPTDLISIDLGSGTPTVLSTGHTGTPAPAVRIGDCAYAAWSGSGSADGSVVTRCGEAEEVGGPIKGTDLVLRSNRGEVMLNDRKSGAVWNIDNDVPQQVDNWDAFAPQKRKNDDGDKNKQDDPDADDQPPKPKPDQLGARPGGTTVLHVLDNDQAPNGRLLAISRVGTPSDPDVKARVSPDGQTVLVEVPEGATGNVGFQYWVNAGNGKDVDARVTVPIKGLESVQPPKLREGYGLVPPPTYVVPARGAVNVAVLGDWRDPSEGDAVSLTDASVKAGSVDVTAAGNLRFQAPPTGGRETISYTITDSAGGTAKGTVAVTVQGPKVLEATPAQAQPDLGRGIVGEPIVVRPLANDIPGADPLDRKATLVIAAPVVSPAGLRVTTDQASGELSIVGTRPGTYQLGYQAGFGDAAPSPATIRVDVGPKVDDVSPVTVPDSVTLFGTSQGVVDVLANDYDPQGRVLVTQRAELLGKREPVDVSVIDGHWVRVRATGPVSRNPLTVRYTITNGKRGGVTGDLVVRTADALSPARDQPVTTDDFATVRAGGGVVIPVLDNDFTPSGAPVALVAGGPGGADGRLEVTPAVGEASVSGRLLRFSVPRDVTVAQTVDVEYSVANANGAVAVGTAHVNIIPVPSDSLLNQAPTPPTVEARVVSGDTVKIKIPTGNADPDGDAVTVTGVRSATTLGRVAKFGATEVQYEAFPSQTGTDTFSYEVTDPYGGVAQGTIRVAVVQPEQAQSPVAVDDSLVAAPGRKVTVRPLTNDYVATGDRVEILPLDEADLPDGVELVSPTGPIIVTARERVVQVRYRITNGIDTSPGTVTVRGVRGYNNPPVVFDAFGKIDGAADVVSVDLLDRAFDPDADAAAIKLVGVAPSVYGEVTTRPNGKATVPLGKDPQVLSYTATDADGAIATAFLYVPAALGDAPYLADNETITLPQGKSRSIPIADLVADPNGRTVRLTTKQSDQRAAPAESLSLEAKDKSTLLLAATDPDYIGPGSITFEVTNAADLGDEDAETVVLTVPVQVGQERPVFRCPEAPLRVDVGGTPITPDIASLCHVWTPDPETSLEIEARAVSPALDDLDIETTGGSEIEISAPGGMAPTENAGEIEVSDVATGATGTIRVKVFETGPPSLLPVSIEGVEAGETTTVDLTSSFTSPLADGITKVVSISQNGDDNAGSESVNGSSVDLTPREGSSGRMSWQVVVSDVEDTSRTVRQATSTITLDVRDRPGQPSAPRGVDGDTTVDLTWTAPDANGAPITGYQVTWNGGSQRCSAAPRCTITGLKNAQPYRFSVVATNAVGDSEPSPPSAPVTPDAVPTAVNGLTSGTPTDHLVAVSWAKPTKDTSIQNYIVSWPGHRHKTTQLSFPAKLADNNSKYTIKVYASNKKGVGPARSIVVQSSGRPATPTGVAVASADDAGEQVAVTVSWSHSNWEGPAGRYVVTRSDGRAVTVGSSVRSVRQTIGYDGKSYTWTVKAVNGTPTNVPSHTSAVARSAPFQAADVPESPSFPVSTATGADTEGHFEFSAGEVRGTGARYELQTDKGTTSGAIGSGGSKSVDVPADDNGSDVTPQVRICNDQKGCSPWAVGQQIRPFGPIRSGAIVNLGTGASGTQTNFSVLVDTNGRPATVQVTGNRGYSNSWNVDSRGQVLSGSQEVGFSTNETFTVTVSDGGRGSTSRSSTSPTTASAPPTVTVSKGASAEGRPGCSSAACRYVVARTSGFPGSVRCTTSSNLGSGEFVAWTQGGEQSYQSPNYFGASGGWVEVTCNGITSARFLW